MLIMSTSYRNYRKSKVLVKYSLYNTNFTVTVLKMLSTGKKKKKKNDWSNIKYSPQSTCRGNNR